MSAMRTWFFCAVSLAILAPQRLTAQAPSYDADAIPGELREHANAVVRDEEMSIEIDKLSQVWITRKKAVTILNANGKYAGGILVYYNKSRPVQSISGALYDARGRLLRKFKKSDFHDISAVQDFSLFEDDRVKTLLPSAPGYPYTVAFEYRQKYKFTLYLPKWIPVPSDGIAVQKSTLRVSSPPDIPIRYYASHVNKQAADSSENGFNYTWTIKNLPALAAEPYSPPFFQSDVPIVIISPERFEYYGMKGSFHNWKEYGQWACEHLLEGRGKLPESTVTHIRQLTRGLASPREIARKIYAYARQKNRYVSIQIGKGGFEPMKASEVDKVSYGDCKALVNYTMSLLRAVNIPAYYTEVYAGDDNISLRPGFASAAQGNHVILCVPFGRDTAWLECTDKHMPFGYLGSFTDNRNVVICTPRGGILTRTPAYKDNMNLQQRRARFTIDSAGNLEGDMTTTFGGLLYEKRQPYETLSNSGRIKRVKAAYSLIQMNISTYNLAFTRSRLPEVKEGLSFTSPRYAAPSDNGWSVPLNPVNRFTDIPPMVGNRKNKVYIARGYVMTDSIAYVLPRGYMPTLVPEDVKMNTPFGDYTVRIRATDHTLTYRRTFRLHSGYYPADSYAKFVRFLQQAAAYDRENFVIARHAGG